MLDDRALLALQGPAAAEVLKRHAPGCDDLAFMAFAPADVGGIPCSVARAGYTGEDGFEISVHEEQAIDLARLLLAEEEVAPVGLGARDSLRLEAGLCLYGHDLDEVTTPIEAGLGWAIGKRRREEGGFPGDRIILAQLAEGTARRRVGIRPAGRARPAQGPVSWTPPATPSALSPAAASALGGRPHRHGLPRHGVCRGGHTGRVAGAGLDPRGGSGGDAVRPTPLPPAAAMRRGGD